MNLDCLNENCQRISNAWVKHQENFKNQKKKLDEYRQMNMKLYDDIADLETDIKEKDDFVNKIRKKRNDLENEVKFLMEKVEVKNENTVRIIIKCEEKKEEFVDMIRA